MNDRDRLAGELRILELEDAHRDAKKAYRAKKSDANRKAFEKARDALVDARQEHRRALGRREGTGVA